jgi:hypothetical protein
MCQDSETVSLNGARIWDDSPPTTRQQRFHGNTRLIHLRILTPQRQNSVKLTLRKALEDLSCVSQKFNRNLP